MVNSIVTNDGKTALLAGYSQDADCIDVFSVRSVKPKGYIRHTLKLNQVGTHLSNLSFFHSEVYDNGYEHFFGNMSLSFTIPALKGSGIVSLADYFGYAAILSMCVKIGDTEFVFDGDYLFNQVMNLNEAARNTALEEAGHNSITRRVCTSDSPHEEIISKQRIQVLLILPFGQNWPKNLFPLATNDVINITFQTRPFSSLINRDSKFIVPPNAPFENTELCIEMFMKTSQTRPLYEPRIDMPYKTYSENEVKFPATRTLSLIQKCWNESLLYPMFIGNWTSEKDVIDQVVNYCINEIIHVVKNDEIEAFKSKYPSTAIFTPVVDSLAFIRKETQFQQRRKVIVSITNVPANHTVLYHSNLLVINKALRNGVISSLDNPWMKDWNISEKFMEICGTYDSATNQVLPIRVRHTIRTQYASIPLNAFQKCGEDNRPLGSTNYYIMAHFSHGPNIYNPSFSSSYQLKLYDEKAAVPENYIIQSGKGIDVLSLTRHANPYQLALEIMENQNNSRFSFGNIDGHKFVLTLSHNPFTVYKDELTNMLLPNKELTDVRHREEGFESLYEKVQYHVTYYQSKQISQSSYINNKQVSRLS